MDNREQKISDNIGLVHACAKRFKSRGIEYDDLFQAGCLGLVKAVDGFDDDRGVKFSTYAVPMIAGEIRRFLRDDGMLKVSRSIKENCSKVFQTRAELERSLGREPDMEELARAVNMAPEELAMTMEAGAPVESIYKTVYQGEGTEITLADRLEEKENRQEKLLNRILLEEVLGKLEKDERRLICMRYFQDMTQTEIAGRLGISQVQVSRMEKRIIKRLREFYDGS